MRLPILEQMRLVGDSSFADADPQPMPFMLEDVDWETIKETIKKGVEITPIAIAKRTYY